MIGGKGYKSTPKESDEDGTKEEKFDRSAAKKEAAKAVIRGVKNGDVQMVEDALQAHYDACSGE